MLSRTESNLRLAEIAHEIKALELEASRLELEYAEFCSLAGHDQWLDITDSCKLWVEVTGEQADQATRQRIRRLAESGRISAKRATRRDGQPGKHWRINKLSLSSYLERAEAYKNGEHSKPTQWP